VGRRLALGELAGVAQPTYGLWSDGLHYWYQVEGFKEVGFDSGYFVVNERPAPAR
jgi:hypothetical protein